MPPTPTLDRLPAAVIFGLTTAGILAVVWGVAMLAWGRRDTRKEPVRGQVVAATIVGGVIAASAAQIINQAYG